ncbi:MAG: serine/threonine protein kinase, partial [Gammaproteobacteria bacterium]|nr:serine/threonine protein kinase [Gammaproteobacteria bacterium]
MALNVGDRLGHYDVTALIGEGGMGQVYQATDTKLNRQVALKILPEAFAADPDRLARFQREAQVLASLNHPNIAAIHGIEEADGNNFLVMELAEGEDLSTRLSRGPIQKKPALEIACQIALALEAAHEKNIIHRDLKPANIKVSDEDQVKILDFGLAKMISDESTAGTVTLGESPTITSDMTRTG